MRRIIIIAVLLAALTGMALTAAAQDETAQIRFAHFSSGGSPLDIYLNGQRSDVRGLGFGSVSAWLEVEAGTHSIEAAPAGDSPEDAEFAPIEVTLDAGDWVTVSAIGTVDLSTAFLHPVLEDFSPIVEGEARITLFHASPDAGPLNLLLADGSDLIRVLAYPLSIGSNDGAVSVDLISNTYDFSVVASDDPENTLYDLSGTILAPGKNYLLVLAGNVAGATTVLVGTDPESGAAEGGTPTTVDTGDGTVQVRAAYFAPGGDDADVFLNGERFAAGDLDFGSVSEWVEVPSGVYEVAFAPTGGSLDDAYTAVAEVPLVAGEWVTLAAVGGIENDTAFVQAVVEDFSNIVNGETRITFFNGIPDAGPLTLQLQAETPLLQTIGFPQTLDGNDGAASVDILAGTYTLEVVAFDDPETVLFSLEEQPLAGGSHYFVAVAGLANGAVTVLAETEQ